MTTPSRRHFSTKSIRVLADDINAHLGPTTLDAFLHTLSQIDCEIQNDFTHVRAELASTQHRLKQETTLRQAAEKQLAALKSRMSTRQIKLSTEAECNCHPEQSFFSGPHKQPCPLRNAIMSEPSSNVADLLLAREDAFRNQQVLVKRLKRDNTDLKASYDALWARNNAPDDPDEPDIGNLRDRVQKAGQAATRVEERLKITVRDVDSFRTSMTCSVRMSQQLALANPPGPQKDTRISTYEKDCNLAAADLLRTLALQQDAHEKLRATVVELTHELERIDPRKMGATAKYSEQLDVVERRLHKAERVIVDRDTEIAKLKRQQKKVLAEYEAISVAHSYSTAELSKIRANKKKTKKGDRHERERGHGKLGAGVENLLHHRKIHFR